ncbi:hypothetical protein EAM_0305 [Erwinia amylovora ATCC 49946]|nr:hypothetical protein EAM_0305 [Erwinia amylovora ATCC 49946]
MISPAEQQHIATRTASLCNNTRLPHHQQSLQWGWSFPSPISSPLYLRLHA